MAIFRWRDPFNEQFREYKELDRLQNEVNRLYESFFGRRPFSSKSGLFPAVNVSEDRDQVVVTAELPGVEASDLEITVEEESLIIKGVRRIESQQDEVSYHRREREGGAFNRKISLPNRISPDKVSAETKNGILRVILPKAEELKPKKIEIKVQ